MLSKLPVVDGMSFNASIFSFIMPPVRTAAVSYTHLRAHETVLDLVCRLLLEKKKDTPPNISAYSPLKYHPCRQHEHPTRTQYTRRIKH